MELPKPETHFRNNLHGRRRAGDDDVGGRCSLGAQHQEPSAETDLYPEHEHLISVLDMILSVSVGCTTKRAWINSTATEKEGNFLILRVATHGTGNVFTSINRPEPLSPPGHKSIIFNKSVNAYTRMISLKALRCRTQAGNERHIHKEGDRGERMGAVVAAAAAGASSPKAAILLQ